MGEVLLPSTTPSPTSAIRGSDSPPQSEISSSPRLHGGRLLLPCEEGRLKTKHSQSTQVSVGGVAVAGSRVSLSWGVVRPSSGNSIDPERRAGGSRELVYDMCVSWVRSRGKQPAN
jgi:hypothetical protein